MAAHEMRLGLVAFSTTTARLSSMRRHVAALAAVWLAIMGWYGSSVVAQPVNGLMLGQPDQQLSGDEQYMSDLWGMVRPNAMEAGPIQDDAADIRRDEVYYFPAAPVKRQSSNDDDWLPHSQGRSKRQQNHQSMPRLSIISPMDALRARMLVVYRSREREKQAVENQHTLDKVGKRRKRSGSAALYTGAHPAPAISFSHVVGDKRMNQPMAAIKTP